MRIHNKQVIKVKLIVKDKATILFLSLFFFVKIFKDRKHPSIPLGQINGQKRKDRRSEVQQ